MLKYMRQFFRIRVNFHTLFVSNEVGDPQFFYISDRSNSHYLTVCSKHFLKKYIYWKMFA